MDSIVNDEIFNSEGFIFEESIKNYRINQVEDFANYLSYVYMDLTIRNGDDSKGVDKLTFCQVE